MEWKPLPVGIDDFEKIVTGDYFYGKISGYHDFLKVYEAAFL